MNFFRTIWYSYDFEEMNSRGCNIFKGSDVCLRLRIGNCLGIFRESRGLVRNFLECTFFGIRGVE